jgi:ribonuclease P protein component
MHKLTRNQTQKLFLKSKLIFKTAFFYIKIHYLSENEYFSKNIIVIPKKCGIAVRRNYIRRITKELIKKYTLPNINASLIVIYKKSNLDGLDYNSIKLAYIDFINFCILKNH